MGKFRAEKRRYQKKKKVFAGGKPYTRNDDNLLNEHSPAGPSHLIDTTPSTTVTSNETERKEVVVYKKIINESKQKLKNSPFIRDVGKTRRQKKKLSGDVVMMNKTKCVAEGYKLIQMDLLQKCLQRAVKICKNCFSRRSKMELFHNPGSKKGLAEELIFKCNMCHHESKFMTSSKCTVNKKKSANAYNINVRSTYASQHMGLRGLEKFCGLLDLPRPTHKNAYNKIQKNISEVAVQNAEKAMKEAAGK